MDKKLAVFLRISMALHLFSGLSIFLPWIQVDGEYKNLPVFLWQAAFATELKTQDPMVYVFAVFGFLQLISAVCSIVYGVAGLLNRNLPFLRQAVHWIQFVYIAAVVTFFGLVPMLWTFIIPLFSLADVLINIWLSQRDEIHRLARQQKERERQERLERKRRLAFPGHYSRHYYRVLLENVIYHFKNYALLVISGTFMTMYLFLTFALQAVFSGSHSEEALLLGTGLQKILVQAVVMGLVLNVILMALSFTYYIRRKTKEEGIFLLLGIRSRTQTMILIMEYSGCTLLALILGLLSGRLVLQILLGVVGKELFLTYSGIPGYYYLIVIGIYTGAALLAAVINHEIYDRMKYESAELLAPEKIRLPGKGTWFTLPLGIWLVAEAVRELLRVQNGENTACQFELVFGIWFCLISILGFMVRRDGKKGKNYYRKVFQRLPFYQRFWKNTNTLALLSAAGFFSMYMFTVPLAGLGAASPAEELFPYDFVCMGDWEDEDIFTEIETSCQAEIYHFPMLRGTTPQGDRPTWVDNMNNQFFFVIWPQGQHVIVSESTFQEMKKMLGKKAELPDLREGEIYTVFQQDTSFPAHPLSWYLYQTRTDPSLRVGQPLTDYDWAERDALYPPRKQTGSEISIVTGMFGRGDQENLAVISDTWFAELSAGETEGPTELFLLNMPADKYDEAEVRLQEFAERHKSDSQWDSDIRPFYGKKQMIQDTKSERYLRATVWIFSFFMAAFSGVFLLLEKFLLEMDETVAKYRHLKIVGMREKERKKTLKRELRTFWAVPLTVSGAAALVFTVITFRLRQYTLTDIENYLKYAIAIWGIYWVCQAVFFNWIGKLFLQKTEEE